jgi:hypothetical protein
VDDVDHKGDRDNDKANLQPALPARDSVRSPNLQIPSEPTMSTDFGDAPYIYIGKTPGAGGFAGSGATWRGRSTLGTSTTGNLNLGIGGLVSVIGGVGLGGAT